ncbi:response regulator [bacterium]|nr:response regulator [bacterium]
MSEVRRILVVEDEMQFAKMVKMRLESVGYEVDVSGDAYSGTQKIIREAYDLVILDLMMPAGGGFTILERIRKFPNKADLPVIILTGKTIDDTVKNQARSLKVAHIFSKPYDAKEFLAAVAELIDN